MELRSEEEKYRRQCCNSIRDKSHRPRARPRIVISANRTWPNRLGLTRLTYQRMIWRAGGLSRRVHYDSMPHPKDETTAARQLLKSGDGLLLTGGGDVDPVLYGDRRLAHQVNPKRDRFEIALIREARSKGLPIFGVCRGCQLLNVALGGTLRTLREDKAQRRYHIRITGHPVEVSSVSRAAAIVGIDTPLHVTSWHGQAVDEPAPALRIVGRAPDGIVELIESNRDPSQETAAAWILGVQWHPEMTIWHSRQHALVADFVAAARNHVRQNGRENVSDCQDRMEH